MNRKNVLAALFCRDLKNHMSVLPLENYVPHKIHLVQPWSPLRGRAQLIFPITGLKQKKDERVEKREKRHMSEGNNKIIQSYRDLIVYQLAFKSAMSIFEISKYWPKEEKYSLTDQMRRS